MFEQSLDCVLCRPGKAALYPKTTRRIVRTPKNIELLAR